MNTNVDILKIAEDVYRKSPQFGIQFGIEPEDYNANVRIRFSSSCEDFSNGTYVNNQEIIYKNKIIGLLSEICNPGKLFSPIRHQFLIPLSDDVSDAERKNPHFLEDEWNYMAFSSLQDMLDYLGIKQGYNFRLRKRK